MKFILKKIPGVTLIEMLVVMALFPLVLVTLTWVFATITEGQLNTIAQSSLDQEQQFIFSRLNADINRATRLLLPATTGASASALQLQLPDGQVQYGLSGGSLIRTDATGSAAINSTRARINSFSAARLGSQSGYPFIRVVYSLTSTASAQTQEMTRETTTTFGLRMKP